MADPKQQYGKGGAVPSVHAPAPRRMRHLRGITARGLGIGSEEGLLTTFFSLHQASHDANSSDVGTPWYTSEVAYNSNNPQWCGFSADKWIWTDIGRAAGFVVIVWDCSKQPLRVALQLRVNLDELMFLSTSDFDLPDNSLLFQLTDGYYVTKEVRLDLEERALIIRHDTYAEEGNLKLSCPRIMVVDIVKKKRELEHDRAELEKLKSRIESKFAEKTEYYAAMKERNDYAERIALLKQELAQQEELVKRQKDEIALRKYRLLPQALQLQKSQVALRASANQMYQDQRHLGIQKARLEETLFLIREHTVRLLCQLKEVYRVERLDDGTFTINGFVLPNSNFTGCDEEKIATALGYVCHALQLLCRYLSVPLRYPMAPMLSRSSIQDPISNLGKYPLFSKGQDATRFEYGVFLLNKNLEQLVHSEGLEIESLRATLPNLKLLLDSFKPTATPGNKETQNQSHANLNDVVSVARLNMNAPPRPVLVSRVSVLSPPHTPQPQPNNPSRASQAASPTASK